MTGMKKRFLKEELAKVVFKSEDISGIPEDVLNGHARCWTAARNIIRGFLRGKYCASAVEEAMDVLKLSFDERKALLRLNGRVSQFVYEMYNALMYQNVAYTDEKPSLTSLHRDGWISDSMFAALAPEWRTHCFVRV